MKKFIIAVVIILIVGFLASRGEKAADVAVNEPVTVAEAYTEI